MVHTDLHSFPTRRSSDLLRQSSGRGTPLQDDSDRRQQRRSAYEVNAIRSRFQTAALRAARREAAQQFDDVEVIPTDRKSTRLNSSHTVISYAVFCLKKKI